jgi:peptidoglycan hydrolase-like protein with peptidoglycan-binding domain
MPYPHDLAGEDLKNPPGMPSHREVAYARALLLERPPMQRTAAPWRPAASLAVLKAEANACNPNRDRASDGALGNEAHAQTVSDHNPNRAGVVRALDLDVDGLDLATAVEKCRAYAWAGWLPQLLNGGYLIFNRRITREDWSGWKAYLGPNPHTGHAHFSVGVDAAQYDDARPWLIFTDNPWPAPGERYSPGPPVPAPSPVAPVDVRRLERGPNHYPPADPRHAATAAVQTRLRTRYPLYAKRLQTDGWFGAATEAAVREFQRRSPGLIADGVAGPLTLARLGL